MSRNLQDNVSSTNHTSIRQLFTFNNNNNTKCYVISSSATTFIIRQSLNVSTHTHTHPFNGPLSGTTQVSRYQKGKTNRDFTEATDSEWQWHQLGCVQVCTSLQTNNHAITPPLSFLQAGCPSCHPTNSVKSTEGIKCLNKKLNKMPHYQLLLLLHLFSSLFSRTTKCEPVPER